MRRSVTDIYNYIYIYIIIYIYPRESLVRNHEPCAKALGNYLYVQWVAMVFLVYFPRRFGMHLPLVAMALHEASALMRISSTL